MKRTDLPIKESNILTELQVYLDVSRCQPPTGLTMLHYHSHLEFGLCIRGGGVFYIRDNVYPYSEGDISVIFPGERHIAQSSLSASSDWWFITVDIPFLMENSPDRAVLTVVAKSGDGHILSHTERQQVQDYLKRVVSLCPGGQFAGKEKKGYIAALFTCILYEMAEWKKEVAGTDTAFPGHIQTLEPVIRCMLDRYADALTVEELCRCCHMSSPHLRRIFRETMRTSLMAFLHRIRISHACTALANTELSVLEIAGQCGYSSLSSFNRKFRKIMFMTPSVYRKEHGK